MSDPRYRVCSIEGSSAHDKHPTIAYWISDRLYGFREVAWFRPVGARRPSHCRQRADSLCAELNAAHDAWERAA